MDKAIRQSDRKSALSKYLPEVVVDDVLNWIDQYSIALKISKSRLSKLGDYRSPYGKDGHRITINHDLNQYSFFITFLHELAHLKTWERYKRRRIAPHGKEWKLEFKEITSPYFFLEVFPEDVSKALMNYMLDPAASSCTDASLYRTLAKYDTIKQGTGLLVEDLPQNCVFKLRNGMTFEKGILLRKRFRCKEITTGRTYFVSALAEVEELQNADSTLQLALF